MVRKWLSITYYSFKMCNSLNRYLYLSYQVIDDILSDATSSTTYDSVGEMWTLELSQGAEVWIRTKTTSLGEIHGSCHTMFSGFLLFEI